MSDALFHALVLETENADLRRQLEREQVEHNAALTQLGRTTEELCLEHVARTECEQQLAECRRQLETLRSRIDELNQRNIKNLQVFKQHNEFLQARIAVLETWIERAHTYICAYADNHGFAEKLEKALPVDASPVVEVVRAAVAHLAADDAYDKVICKPSSQLELGELECRKAEFVTAQIAFKKCVRNLRKQQPGVWE